MVLKDCKKHDWLYDEFEEKCPLCEAVSAEYLLWVKSAKKALDDLFYKPDATVDNIMVRIASDYLKAQVKK